MLLLILLGLGLSEAQQPEKLVSALDPVIVDAPDGRRTVEVDLTNKAKQDVTYWMVSISYMLSNGDVEYRGHGRDLYPAYSRSRPDSERDRVIPARGTVRAVIDLGQTEGLSVVSVRTEVEGAVFADGSWIGDRLAIQAIFAERERDARALAFVLASLKAGAASASGLDALRVALQRLERKWPNDPDEFATRTMRRNLQMVIDGTLKTSPDEFLEYWIPAIEAAWRVADTHRRAKPSAAIKDRSYPVAPAATMWCAWTTCARRTDAPGVRLGDADHRDESRREESPGALSGSALRRRAPHRVGRRPRSPAHVHAEEDLAKSN